LIGHPHDHFRERESYSLVPASPSFSPAQAGIHFARISESPTRGDPPDYV
jgi:hypothetical protein